MGLANIVKISKINRNNQHYKIVFSAPTSEVFVKS